MAISRERITVEGTGIGLTAATYLTFQFATLTVETAPIRLTLDGTAPVASTTGHLFRVDDVIELSGEEIAKVKMIRDTGTSAAVEVTYRDTE